MESTLRDVLTESRRDHYHQEIVEFLLSVLRRGTPLPSLSQILLEIVRDNTRRPSVTRAALDAFTHNSADSPDRTSKLRRLLVDIRTGRVSDLGDDLLESLLTHLYPREICPSEIWAHLTEWNLSINPAPYSSFWERRLLERSSDADVAELLDHLHKRLPGLRSALESHLLDHLPMELLARGCTHTEMNRKRDVFTTGSMPAPSRLGWTQPHPRLCRIYPAST